MTDARQNIPDMPGAKLFLPDIISEVIDALRARGFSGYAVGGCVRDMLMGKKPHDFDVTTDALPEEIKSCFPGHQTIDTGIKHGTVTVVCGKKIKENVEITTFRTDGKYLDNRHPESVTFVRDLREDLSRRDFTVNAMAYNRYDGVTDIFGGKEDIVNKIVRCVGDPDERFNEDGLRILRAMRFSSVLGFAVEEKTADSVLRNRKLLGNISVERIFSEMTKLICGADAVKVMLRFQPVVEEIFGKIPEENIRAVGLCPNDPNVRYSALLASFGEKGARDAIKKLKTDSETLRAVTRCVKYHGQSFGDASDEEARIKLKFFISEVGYGDFYDIVSLEKAFASLRGSSCEHLDRAREYAEDLERSRACLNVGQLAVGGNDLIALGIEPSKRLGTVMKELLSAVISGKIPNERSALLDLARKII